MSGLRVSLILLMFAGPSAIACTCAITEAVPLLRLDGTKPPPTPAEIRRIAVNAASGRIEVKASLDHEEYSGGQSAELRVSFHNPTSDRLEVWDWQERNVYVDQLLCSCGWNPTATRSIGPQETIEQVIRSTESFTEVNVPYEPGEHKLYLRWGGNPQQVITFRVLRPTPSLQGIFPPGPGYSYPRKPGEPMVLFGKNLQHGCPNARVTVGGVEAKILSHGDWLGVSVPAGVTSGVDVPVRLTCDGQLLGEIPTRVQ